MNQQPLKNVSVTTQLRSPHATGFILVGKAAFDSLSTLAQQLLAPLAANPSAVGVHSSLLLMFADPVASTAVGL